MLHRRFKSQNSDFVTTLFSVIFTLAIPPFLFVLSNIAIKVLPLPFNVALKALCPTIHMCTTWMEVYPKTVEL